MQGAENQVICRHGDHAATAHTPRPYGAGMVSAHMELSPQAVSTFAHGRQIDQPQFGLVATAPAVDGQ